MPMERKEPVIDSRAVDLTDRVKLTWRGGSSALI